MAVVSTAIDFVVVWRAANLLSVWATSSSCGMPLLHDIS